MVFTVEQRGSVIADFAVMTYAGDEGITQSTGLSMNDSSIATEDTCKSHLDFLIISLLVSIV